MSTSVTSKGQVTIPKPMRDYLGLTPGSRVEFVYADDGRVVIRPVGAPKVAHARKTSRFAALRGKLKLGMPTDEYMQLVRGYEDDANDPGFRAAK